MSEPNWQLSNKRNNLIERARILTEIRAFFVAGNFLEVETPQRIPCNAPEPYIDPIASESWALQTSPELCMKRLLAAGYPLIFQICHCWRAAERGKKHLPEFTMLEWYRLNSDYNQLMDDCEQLLRYLIPTQQLNYRGQLIDISKPFERLSLTQAFNLYAPLSLHKTLAQDNFEEIYSQHVEPQLGQSTPTIIYDYPREMASLARTKHSEPNYAERFELYIAGVELANAFSELTDHHEQRQRFTDDEQLRRKMGKPAYPLPEKFLNELKAIPTAAGIALGIDRLIMLLTDCDEISNVVAFSPEEL